VKTPTTTDKPTEVVGIRLEPDLLARVRKTAAEEDRSVSATIRHIVREALRARGGGAVNLPFGQFKGTPIADVDVGYLKWLSELEYLRDPLKTAVLKELARRAQPALPAVAPAPPSVSPSGRHQCPSCGATLIVTIEGGQR
jgi:hypothetical protein